MNKKNFFTLSLLIFLGLSNFNCDYFCGTGLFPGFSKCPGSGPLESISTINMVFQYDNLSSACLINVEARNASASGGDQTIASTQISIPAGSGTTTALLNITGGGLTENASIYMVGPNNGFLQPFDTVSSIKGEGLGQIINLQSINTLAVNTADLYGNCDAFNTIYGVNTNPLISLPGTKTASVQPDPSQVCVTTPATSQQIRTPGCWINLPDGTPVCEMVCVVCYTTVSTPASQQCSTVTPPF